MVYGRADEGALPFADPRGLQGAPLANAGSVSQCYRRWAVRYGGSVYTAQAAAAQTGIEDCVNMALRKTSSSGLGRPSSGR